MRKIAVVGGGAAGMLAAYAAAAEGSHVTLFEKNEKLGKKLYITGKGRCNLTNAADMEAVQKAVVTNPRFLYSAFHSFTNSDIMELMKKAGCPVKVERGQRVFPVSDRSSDVIAALTFLLREKKTEIRLNTHVKKILTENKKVTGLAVGDRTEHFDAVIFASGGKSYPSTGSDGEGYEIVKELGHNVTMIHPALVPLTCAENWVSELEGLNLKNIRIRIMNGKKKLYEEFGEMTFMKDAVSGPVILSASSFITKYLPEKQLALLIDLKPALDLEQLDARILRDFSEDKNLSFGKSLYRLFPRQLADVVAKQSGIDLQKPVHSVSHEERRKLTELSKAFPLTLVGTHDFKEAIITQGGLSVKEVDPSTMESKLIQGLYFCGEILDLDAVTGGFNLQIAWSTGYLAGRSAGQKMQK